MLSSLGLLTEAAAQELSKRQRCGNVVVDVAAGMKSYYHCNNVGHHHDKKPWSGSSRSRHRHRYPNCPGPLVNKKRLPSKRGWPKPKQGGKRYLFFCPKCDYRNRRLGPSGHAKRSPSCNGPHVTLTLTPPTTATEAISAYKLEKQLEQVQWQAWRLQMWKCRLCTALNKKGSTRCSVCRKGKRTAAQRQLGEADAQSMDVQTMQLLASVLSAEVESLQLCKQEGHQACVGAVSDATGHAADLTALQLRMHQLSIASDGNVPAMHKYPIIPRPQSRFNPAQLHEVLTRLASQETHRYSAPSWPGADADLQALTCERSHTLACHRHHCSCDGGLAMTGLARVWGGPEKQT